MIWQEHMFALLILVLAANAAPVVAQLAFGSRYNHPLDRGYLWADQRALFGKSKTLRGVLSSYIVTLLLSPIIGISFTVGFLIATGAMLGDLFSSFCKRRLGIPSHGSAPILDQIPESIFPLLLIQPIMHLTWSTWLWIIILFFLFESFLSHLLELLRKL